MIVSAALLSAPVALADPGGGNYVCDYRATAATVVAAGTTATTRAGTRASCYPAVPAVSVARSVSSSFAG